MSDLTYHTEFPAEPARAIKPEARPLPEGMAEHIPAMLACKSCDGAGHKLSIGYSYTEEETGEKINRPSKWETCYDCKGSGWFHAPDLLAIVTAIKGRKAGKLKSKRPDDARPYFVWRLARFHGGQDTCMPMGAEMEIGGDPYKGVLDTLAQLVAKRLFGSSNYGTGRWQQAIHGSHNFTDIPRDLGMMPVYDADKPACEMLETV